MDWSRIIYLFSAGLMLILSLRTMVLLRRVKRLQGDSIILLDSLREYPEVVPCYECRFHLEGEPFCPKSGMKMKDGLIFCCYGERKEDGSDEGNADNNG